MKRPNLAILFLLLVPAFLLGYATHNAVQPASVTDSKSGSCRSCDYVVPPGLSHIDGRKLKLKPGSTICLDAHTQYRELNFAHLNGSPSHPILVTNCGGTAVVNAPDSPFIVKFSYSRHFRFSGGSTRNTYGIRLSESKSNGLVLGPFSSDFQVDHIEISQVGFAGIMAKTEPECNEATHRGNFVMRNITFEQNFIHDTSGEGFYVGHTAFTGAKTPCGEVLPHLLENVTIRDNFVRNSGWDAIQLSCATRGASIYKNTIENYSVSRKHYQSGGITIGTGTAGVCYSNIINSGFGPGIVVFGLADNYVYNNIVINPEGPGVFCDERADVGPGYFFFNNTIINPRDEGFKLYSELAPTTVVVNNIIINAGAVNNRGVTTPITTLREVNLDSGRNYFSSDISRVNFVDPSRLNFKLSARSPLIDQGRDVSVYLPNAKGFSRDFYGASRKEDEVYDIGAAEYQPSGIFNWFRKLFSPVQ